MMWISHIFTTLHKTALALRGKVIPGVDDSVDFPSIYDVEELDVSNNQTKTVVNESACNYAIEELDVKLPETQKAQNVLLEDLVPCSRFSPSTATSRFGMVNNSLCHRMSTTFMYSMTTTRVL